MVHWIAKFLKILNSESEPGQISMALCLAMVMGFTPLYTLHNLLLLFIVLLVRVNLSAFIFGWTVFKGFTYILDPLFHAIGFKILTLPALESLWTWFYNIPLLRLAHFNNSIVMGSLFISLALFLPLYFALNVLIRRYRTHLLGWIEKTRIMQIIKTSKLYSAYKAVS